MQTTITDAVIVRLVDYGEADRIATLLTRSAGKVTAMARGARRSRRRFGGAVELFGLGEATLRQGRGELWMLEGFDSRRGYSGIALDVARIAHAAYVCELARELVPDEARDERVYNLVVESLARIDGGHTSALALRVFELALLDAVGLAPCFDRCVGCGDPPLDDDRQLLDVRRGGVMCGHCGAAVGGALSSSVRVALLAAQRAGGAELDEWSSLSAGDGAHARDALQALLAEHLRRPLRSVEFIAKLNAASHG